MKAILEFSLPEEQDDHAYALSGLDALLVISDLENEIRSKLRYDSGEFREFQVEEYNEDGSVSKKRVRGCDHTLEKVWNVLLRFKSERNLPELV
jgi:hypothetical protein